MEIRIREVADIETPKQEVKKAEIEIEQVLGNFYTAKQERDKAAEKLRDAQKEFDSANLRLKEIGNEIARRRNDIRFEDADGWDMPRIAVNALKAYGATDEQIEKAGVITDDEFNPVNTEKFDQVLRECGWEIANNIKIDDFDGFGEADNEIHASGADVVLKRVK